MGHRMAGVQVKGNQGVDSKQQVLYGVNTMRRRHPKKDVEQALADATEAGWTVVATASGHRWGVLRCGEASRARCQVSIWSTPRNSGNHARQIRRALERCPHEWSSEENLT